MKLRTWIILVLLFGAAAAGGWWWYRRAHAAEEPQYLTAVITRGKLTQVATATGQLNPVVNVQVGSQISGIVKNLHADYNSMVTQGQVIAQLDPATYQATVHQSEGDLANARAVWELAQVNERRMRELREKQLIPQADYDKSVADLHQAEAAVKVRTAALERTTVDLARCTIYAPIGGVVISRNVDVGQTVAASLSAPTLFVIANDLAKMQIHANVAEADVGQVEVDQAVSFTVDAFPQRPFRGTVRQIRNSPITVQNVVSYVTVIDVDNPDLKLKPGMTATVSIIIAEQTDALKLPSAALRFRPPDSASNTNHPSRPRETGTSGSGRPRAERSLTRTVYTLPAGATRGTPQPVQIKVGISDGTAIEVIEGLTEGATVITGQKNGSSASPATKTNPFSGGGPPPGMPRRF
jgi:HlyD family secretion protein